MAPLVIRPVVYAPLVVQTHLEAEATTCCVSAKTPVQEAEAYRVLARAQTAPQTAAPSLSGAPWNAWPPVPGAPRPRPRERPRWAAPPLERAHPAAQGWWMEMVSVASRVLQFGVVSCGHTEREREKKRCG